MKIAIVGGGLSGLTLGYFLSQQGIAASVFEGQKTPQDRRSLVLTHRTTQLLSPVIASLKGVVNPIGSVMLMGTGTRLTHVIRPPKPHASLGQVMPAAQLYGALQGAVDILPQRVTDYQASDAGWVIQADNGKTYQAEALVFANGSLSIAKQWGLPIEQEPAHQSALVMTWQVAGHTDSQAIECLLPTGGALTLVPRGRGVFGLVLIDAFDHIQALSEKNNEEQQRILQHWLSPRWSGRLIEPVGQAQSFPLTPQRVLSQVAGRAAFIGHAAHIFHPIAAQGYNTTVYESHALAAMLAKAPSSDWSKVLASWDVQMQQHHRQLEWVMSQLLRGLKPRPAWMNGLAFQAMRFAPKTNQLWYQLTQGLSV